MPCDSLLPAARPALSFLWFALLLCCGPAQGQSVPSGITVISEPEYVQDDALSPPAADSPWQVVRLPVGDRLADESQSNQVFWFRLSVDKPSAATLYGLYIYRHNLALDVFFNGQRIGGDIHRAGWHTMAWNHPLLVPIQPANWLPGRNEIMLRFSSSYFGGTLSPVLFGPMTSLIPLYDQRQFRQVTVNEWLQVFGIFVTVLSLVLWAMRRHDITYLLFAGSSICWTIVTTHMVAYHNLLSYQYWLPLVHIAIDLWILFTCLFLARLLDIRSRRSEQLLKAWTGLALLWHLLGPMEIWWMGAYLIHIVGNGFLFLMLVRVVRLALRERNRMAMAVCGAILVQIGFFTHDAGMILFSEAEDWESAMYYSTFAFPLMLAVFTASLLRRFTRALQIAEELNRDLEAKVAASRQLIEQSFAERRTLELQQAAQQERMQIYRDLHDDVGSKLLSIVHAGRDSRLGELASSALQSLRDAVSRANNPARPLDLFLAELREESELRLRGAGHNFHWEQPDELPDLVVSSRTAYNLNRIFKELVSNIIRHAGADEVVMRVIRDRDRWRLVLSDNGRGFDSSAVMGNGIRNINSRAAELDARAQWEAVPGQGVTLTLELASL